jgi:hypothetical protein
MLRLTGHLQLRKNWPTWASSVLITPPYSSDLAPLDYDLFCGLKKQLKCGHFLSDMESIAAAETWLDGQLSEFFLSCLQKLEHWAKKCIECDE